MELKGKERVESRIIPVSLRIDRQDRAEPSLETKERMKRQMQTTENREQRMRVRMQERMRRKEEKGVVSRKSLVLLGGLNTKRGIIIYKATNANDILMITRERCRRTGPDTRSMNMRLKINSR